MTKTEIIRYTAKATHVTQETAATIINAALDIVTNALREGDPIILHNFGKLDVRQHKCKTTYNFHTAERMTIPERRTITFIPAKGLKEYINEKDSNE